MSITFVQNNFIKNLFITNSSERKSDTVRGHTSKPCNSSGKHCHTVTIFNHATRPTQPGHPYVGRRDKYGTEDDHNVIVNARRILLNPSFINGIAQSYSNQERALLGRSRGG